MTTTVPTTEHPTWADARMTAEDTFTTAGIPVGVFVFDHSFVVASPAQYVAQHRLALVVEGRPS